MLYIKKPFISRKRYANCGIMEKNVYRNRENAMPRAIWNGAVIAESDATIVVEGNHYFPPDSVKREYLRDSQTHTVCPWKGTASYYDVVVDGQVNRDAAWYYPTPKAAASQIAGYIAFWRGVRIEPT
jgi:Uncharacterized protein conserved in bacteria, COG2343